MRNGLIMNTDRHSHNLLTKQDTMSCWKLTAYGPALVCSSGVVAVQAKDDDANADFSLKYEWLFKQIKANPGASEYSMSKWAPMTLARACNENKLDQLGNVIYVERAVDVKYELKRVYMEVPKNGAQLLRRQYKSLPRDVSQVASLEIKDEMV